MITIPGFGESYESDTGIKILLGMPFGCEARSAVVESGLGQGIANEEDKFFLWRVLYNL